MSETNPNLPRALTSLSARLLLLTMFFIMVAEFLIWTPSISRFRKVYLEEHIVRAHLSTLTLESMPDQDVDKDLERSLLFHADSYGIVLHRPEQRVLMVSKEMPPKVDLVVDIAKGSFFGWIADAFSTLVQDENRILRVMGTSPKNPEVMVEVLIDETPMREAMYDFSARILQLSIVISLFTAGLVYLSLQWLMVRPMRRITANMAAFRAAPEDATRDMPASGRGDEIGVTERELAVMQGEIRHALQQKTRLATLGAAVAKINHDLRNSLATAVLAFDRLADIDDPEVKSVLPRLYDSVDRAVNLCSQTLNFVSDAAPPLDRSKFALRGLIGEVELDVLADHDLGQELTWQIEIDESIEIEADREQLFRVLSNLARNAREAGAPRIIVLAGVKNGRLMVDVSDNGPGIPAKIGEKLFEPFSGSAKAGGTGLGLVIARDIMKAHGGDLRLVETGEDGTVFQLELPLDSDPRQAA